MKRSRPSRDHRSLRPAVEGLEHRELLSRAPAPAALLSRLAAARRASIAARANAGPPRAARPNFSLGPAAVQQILNALYPEDAPPGPPTPAEVRRQRFTARWVGQYTVGPPRFADRSSTIHLYGVSGGSNQFLKGKFQAAIFPPADPGATPTPGNPHANQVTGVADLFAQNYLQSGTSLVLDLNGGPDAIGGPNRLPTRLTWTYDANTSGGGYAVPSGILPGSGFNQGAGALELHWAPDARPRPGTRGSGHVVLTFEGLINASRIASGVSKSIS